MRAGIVIGIVCLLAVAGCGDDASAPADAPAFEDVAWVATDAAVRPSAAFRDGKVSGSGGCNRYSASYESDADKLTIGKVAATRMACPPPADSVEPTFFAALRDVASWRVIGGQLVLIDARGAPLLRFAKASPEG